MPTPPSSRRSRRTSRAASSSSVRPHPSSPHRYQILSMNTIERAAQKALLPIYEKRREVVKKIPKFWAVALMNHPMIGIHAQHNTDQAALAYLEDVWMVRDTQETRAFVLEFVRPPSVSSLCDARRWCSYSISRRTPSSRTRSSRSSTNSFLRPQLRTKSPTPTVSRPPCSISRGRGTLTSR